MNAAYSEADRILTSAQHHAGEADPATYGQALALVGIGRAILALVHEVEQVGELLRERLPAPATTPCHSSSSGGRDAVPCLLPNGHDGWHKGLGATWSGGTTYPAVLRDAHKRLEANLDGVTTDHAWTER